MKRPLLCCSIFLSLLLTNSRADLIPRKPAGPATSPASPLTDEEMARLREQVAELEKDLARKRGGMHASQIATLKEAMSGNEKAFSFWLECKKEEDFEMKGKTASEYAEWKRKQIKETSTNDAFCAGLRLQCNFLMIAVLHSHAETPAQQAEVSRGAADYVESLVKFCEKEENLAKAVINAIMDTGVDPDRVVTADNLEDTLAKVREASSAIGGDVLTSIFAKHLKLDGSVKPRAGAVSNAGNIDEIYDRLVIQPLIAANDATSVNSAWARRIEQTARIAKATKIKEIEQRYAEVKVPALKFAMYRDQWALGDQKSAATAILALISANPTHKDSNDWLRAMKQMAETPK